MVLIILVFLSIHVLQRFCYYFFRNDKNFEDLLLETGSIELAHVFLLHLGI